MQRDASAHHSGQSANGLSVGIVLAAGQSRRFGSENKLLADFLGAPLAGYSAEAMRNAPFSHRLAVVSDPEVAGLFEGFEIVAAPSGIPQSRSLHLGISRAATLGADRVVVALADTPLVTSELLTEIDRRCAEHGISVSVDGGHRSPPAGFSRGYFDALQRTTGDKGAAGLIGGVPTEALVDAAGRLTDIDTIGDLSSLERTLRQK